MTWFHRPPSSHAAPTYDEPLDDRAGHLGANHQMRTRFSGGR
jgi:hypothetical protein